MTGRTLTPETVATICDLYRSGEKLDYIWYVSGVGRNRIVPVVLENGVPLRPRCKVSDDLGVKLAADYAAGMTASALARRNGLHKSTVLVYVAKNGVPVRSRGGNHSTTRTPT